VVRRIALACLLAALAGVALGRSTAEAMPDVALSSLPPEARDIYVLIGSGGPFRYDRDGVVFGNRERLLPPKPRGYYREYTVDTPGARNRGARRVICGGPRTHPDVCYYTGDHYQSFGRIRE
jgi:ribonuclease T1